jgi:7-cyano-7-deazaguanine synthase in queuosine biosynthesis
MCSFIGIFGRGDKISTIDQTEIKRILDIKGGDSYKYVVISEKEKAVMQIANLEASNDNAYFINYNIHGVLQPHEYYFVIFFSRLAPEMESSCAIDNQPYVHNSAVTVVHGTIGADEMIRDNYDLPKFQVDTELFKFLDFYMALEEVQKSGGKISAMLIDYTFNLNVQLFHNGLGLFIGKKDEVVFYSNIHTGSIIGLDDWVITQRIKSGNHCVVELKSDINQSPPIINKLVINEPILNDSKTFVALYSGGLDITCAVQKAIHQYEDKCKATNPQIEHIHLIYFDWGTNASSAEIKAGYKFEFILQQRGYSATFEVIDAKDMFNSYLNILKFNPRISDSNAKGCDSEEAQTAMSYVPYRNTILLTTVAAIFEQRLPYNNIDFIIGANLTEGMIYTDNSETFIRDINKLIKIGGQSSTYFSVIAPYVNYTKTKMIKDAVDLKFDFDFTTSCYFPDNDGNPCGSCGSCLLRDNALNRQSGTREELG